MSFTHPRNWTIPQNDGWNMYLPFSSYCIEWTCLPSSLPVSLVTPIGLYYTCTVHTTTIVRDGELRSCRYWYMIYSCTIHIIIVKASRSGWCRQTSCVEGWNRNPGVHCGSCRSPLFVILEVYVCLPSVSGESAACIYSCCVCIGWLGVECWGTLTLSRVFRCWWKGWPFPLVWYREGTGEGK